MAATITHPKYVWLDADPGHDDAAAILLAVMSPKINLLGISSTHGNTSADWTAANAARCLHAFGAPAHILVYPGATKPLLRYEKHDPAIHGQDGLGGAEGLPSANDPYVLARIARDENGATIHAIEGIRKHLSATWRSGNGSKVIVVCTGPQTTLALAFSVYPDLLDAVEEIVFMGGGVGLSNRSAAAEYNILVDPHAAQIIMNLSIKKTMIPLNVTHTALVTSTIRRKLLDPAMAAANGPLPPAITPLRHMLSSLMTFFAEAYEATFGFLEGPPLHDALTIVYVAHPELFKCRRYRVDIELEGRHTIGETVVDLWEYTKCDDSWGRDGRNCIVAQSVEVTGAFELLLECVARCDQVSPLNRQDSHPPFN